MKSIYLLLLICFSTAVFAQKKVTSFTLHSYSHTSELSSIDSIAYTYSSWRGSLNENEPKFRLGFNLQLLASFLLTWHLDIPEIQYTSNERWNSSSYPLNLTGTYTKTYDGFYRCTEISKPNNYRTLFTYTSSGKIETETSQSYDTSWETNYVEIYEYDGQDRLIRKIENDYILGSAVGVRLDSFEYLGTTNNIVRGVMHSSSFGASGWEKKAEVNYTWASGKPVTLDYYRDNNGPSIEWSFHGEYNYTGNTLNNIDYYSIDNGAISDLSVEHIFTYNTDGQLTVYKSETSSGSNESIMTYTYDPEGFVTKVEMQRNAGAPAMYVYEIQRFYYINTTGIEENTIELSVFPVPADDQLTVETASEIQKIAVYSLDGKVLIDQTGSLNTIDVSTLSTGSYILNVTTEGGVSSKRFVK